MLHLYIGSGCLAFVAIGILLFVLFLVVAYGYYNI